jgi:hypothetical protein
MPPRRRSGKARYATLTSAQEWELLLWGPSGTCSSAGGEGWCRGDEHTLGCPCSAFASDADREGAWWAGAQRMRRMLNPGHRPWAWWRYQARRDQPADSWQEAALLAEMGELDPDEVRDLITQAGEHDGDERWRAVADAIKSAVAHA